jgi:hypothetical protein
MTPTEAGWLAAAAEEPYDYVVPDGDGIAALTGDESRRSAPCGTTSNGSRPATTAYTHSGARQPVARSPSPRRRCRGCADLIGWATRPGGTTSPAHARWDPPGTAAVVDSRLRLPGVQRLRIVDASVFPRIPGYFIVTSIYMIVEKASDVLLEDADIQEPSVRKVGDNARCTVTP